MGDPLVLAEYLRTLAGPTTRLIRRDVLLPLRNYTRFMEMNLLLILYASNNYFLFIQL